jgi:hypothetical protein
MDWIYSVMKMCPLTPSHACLLFIVLYFVLRRHVAFQGAVPPPPLFLNAVVSLTAAAALLAGGPFLDSSVDQTSSGLAQSTSSSSDNDSEINTKWSAQSWRGGMELGLWKGLGTCTKTASLLFLK